MRIEGDHGLELVTYPLDGHVSVVRETCSQVLRCGRNGSFCVIICRWKEIVGCDSWIWRKCEASTGATRTPSPDGIEKGR